MNEPKKILIVEDETSISELIGEFCRLMGFQSRTVHLGSDVLPAARSYRPDLITLDLILPDISGLDVLEILRGDPQTKEVPVVVISSIASETDVRALLRDCQGVLSKPFRGSTLRRTFHRIIPPEPVAA